MGNSIALATISAGLRELLAEAVSASGLSAALGAAVDVVSRAPDVERDGGTTASTCLFVLLHHVGVNTAGRNVELSTRGAAGNRNSPPATILELQYLIAASAQRELEPELLLGFTLEWLAANPVLSRDALLRALQAASPRSPAQRAILDAVETLPLEQIRLTLVPASIEQLTQSWVSLQLPYRPTLLLQAIATLGQSSTTLATTADMSDPVSV